MGSLTKLTSVTVTTVNKSYVDEISQIDLRCKSCIVSCHRTSFTSSFT